MLYHHRQTTVLSLFQLENNATHYTTDTILHSAPLLAAGKVLCRRFSVLYLSPLLLSLPSNGLIRYSGTGTAPTINCARGVQKQLCCRRSTLHTPRCVFPLIPAAIPTVGIILHCGAVPPSRPSGAPLALLHHCAGTIEAVDHDTQATSARYSMYHMC